MRATMAVILARGLGSRMQREDGAPLSEAQRAAAARGTKGMMPIAGRPLMDYALHEFADAGVTDIVFVVAPDDDVLRARYDELAPPKRLRIRYAVQETARGTAHALLAAREAVTAPAGAPRDDEGHCQFLVANADNLYPAAAIRLLVEAQHPGLVAFDADALVADGLMERERVLQFALLDLAPDDGLRAIVEKPPADHPLALAPQRAVSMNLWRLDERIFDDCAAVQPSARGELELQAAVQRALGRGDRLQAIRAAHPVPDLTHRHDVLALERLLSGRTPQP